MIACLISSCVLYFHHNCIPAIALHHHDDGLLMVNADHRDVFPMTNLLAIFNVRRELAQQSTDGDLPAAISPICVSVLLLLLATQVLPHMASLVNFTVYVLVKLFTTHYLLTCNLLGAALQAKQDVGLLLHPRRYRAAIAADLRAYSGHLTDLLGSVPARAVITTPFPTDCKFMPFQQLGYLRLTLSSINEGVNLISLSLAKLFVSHTQLRLPGQEDLYAKHLHPPIHHMIEFVLCA